MQPLLTHLLTPVEPVIVHPDREMKVHLLLGDGGESSKAGGGLAKAKGMLSSGKNALLGDVSPCPCLTSPVSRGMTDTSVLSSIIFPISSPPSVQQSASSLGYLWLIPSFHLPTDASSIDPSTPRTHTIVFARELIDFRSKTTRKVKIVLEEVEAGRAASNAQTGGVKGEAVPKEQTRAKAVVLGDDGKSDGGKRV